MKSKYELGQKVWMMFNDRPVEWCIYEIIFQYVCIDTIGVYYSLDTDSYSDCRKKRIPQESPLFPTKAALLESL